MVLISVHSLKTYLFTIYSSYNACIMDFLLFSFVSQFCTDSYLLQCQVRKNWIAIKYCIAGVTWLKTKHNSKLNCIIYDLIGVILLFVAVWNWFTCNELCYCKSKQAIDLSRNITNEINKVIHMCSCIHNSSNGYTLYITKVRNYYYSCKCRWLLLFHCLFISMMPTQIWFFLLYANICHASTKHYCDTSYSLTRYQSTNSSYTNSEGSDGKQSSTTRIVWTICCT